MVKLKIKFFCNQLRLITFLTTQKLFFWLNLPTSEFFQSKAKSDNFLARFREIISDPINLLILRNKNSGYVDKDLNVILHNGNKVKSFGRYSYYGKFSNILIINRGVHEPLEEYVFQELLKKLKIKKPLMIEMGCYWAHYSMWLQKFFPKALNILIDSDKSSLNTGKYNFKINNYSGEFILAKIGNRNLELDSFVTKRKIKKINILHADIQGYEFEMIKGAKECLKKFIVDYIFISTHSEILHKKITNYLIKFGYKVEVSSPYELHSTSGDGFIFASSPKVQRLFLIQFNPMGRKEIISFNSLDFLGYLNKVSRNK